VKERRQKLPERPRVNGANPATINIKPENAKKHIRRSGKKRRRKSAQAISPR
jgi:hypothetical protein